MAPSKKLKKAGTIPVRRCEPGGSSSWRVLLVSSSSDPNVFVLPKGGVEKGEKAKEAAVRETLEEGGVTGKLRPGKLGAWEYTTANGREAIQKMWILYVDNVLSCDDPLWKERKRRERRWLTFDEARTLVKNAPKRRPEIVTYLNIAEKALKDECSEDGNSSKKEEASEEEEDE